MRRLLKLESTFFVRVLDERLFTLFPSLANKPQFLKLFLNIEKGFVKQTSPENIKPIRSIPFLRSVRGFTKNILTH